MAFPAPDPALTEVLHEAVASRPEVSERKMFGCPAVFLGEHMFGGVFGDCLNLRLSDADRAEALTQPGFHGFEPVQGRPMREYICLPQDLALDPQFLNGWIDRSLSYARSLPPKRPKARKPSLPAS
jgi:TfoX/Sxy family transcriptional regulator of competence genes